MAINYAQLTTELNTDPKTLGYKVAGVFRSDYDISVLLNTPGASVETLIRQLTDTAEITAAIVGSEFTALSAANRDLMLMLTGSAKVKTGDANLRATLAGVFAAGTTSRTNLIAAASRSCSRAEALFGEGTSVSDIDVAKALGRG